MISNEVFFLPSWCMKMQHVNEVSALSLLLLSFFREKNVLLCTGNESLLFITNGDNIAVFKEVTNLLDYQNKLIYVL